MTDLKFLTTDEQRAEAYAAGADAARAAASWVVDGNSDPERARRLVSMLEDGDPEAQDFLPAYPTLSGEWADDPTPQSLAREILDDDAEDDTTNELAEAWELGVSETFETECERILREFVS